MARGGLQKEDIECFSGGPNSCREKAFNQQVPDRGPTGKGFFSTPDLRIAQPWCSGDGLIPGDC